MKEKLRNLFDEMKVRSRYKSMGEIINMIDPLINQEVEKRIAERMPSENMQHSYAYSYCMQQGMPNGEPEPDMEIYEAFCDGVEWGCGCLTKPGAETSQKTEGGGE